MKNHILDKKKTYSLKASGKELGAILAGLRMLQRDFPAKKVDGNPLHEILTDCGQFEPIDVGDIDALCQSLNLADDPRIVIVMDGGLVTDILSDVPLRGTVIDYDVEDASTDDLVSVPQRLTAGEKPTFEPAHLRVPEIEVIPDRITEILASKPV